MPPDSAAIDSALVRVLLNDPELAGLLPDGVYFDQAPPGATRYALLALQDGNDIPQYGGRAYQDQLYTIKAVMLATLGDLQ